MTTLGAKQSRRSNLALGAGFALVTAMFASVLIRWPDNFFADDSYFYFQVAWNIARGLGSTFNNIMPTNGYHPLWMLVCVAVFKLIPAKAAAVHGIGAAISLADAIALILLSRLLARVAPGMWWAAFFLYIPFCFLSQLGTEGAISGMFLAGLALAAYRLCQAPSGATGLLFAVCGALAVLSRLDNIFIVSFVFLAVIFASPVEHRSPIRRILALCIPLYVVLWGAYIGSNLYWFGTVQPISGLLKAHPHGEPKHLSHPPHIALLGLAIIVPCIAVLARLRRDTFFKTVELPFAAGIVVHGFYVAVVMSSETRWSWYYTSWMLLSSILLARVMSVALAGRRDAIRVVLATAALAALAVAWVRISYRNFDHADPDAVAIGYQENMSDRAHLHTVLSFDKPGRMAYYSDVQVVALDGLMGNLQFQKDLETKGIAAFDAEHHVDGFVGPPQPMDAAGKAEFCDHIHLSSVQLTCVPVGGGLWTADGAEVFARITGEPAGHIPLSPSDIVWSQPGQVAVWRLH